MKLILTLEEARRIEALKRSIVEIFGENNKDFASNFTEDYRGVEITQSSEDVRIKIDSNMLTDFIDTLTRIVSTVGPAALAFQGAIKKAGIMSDLFDIRWGATKSCK